jgi:MFS superfamily sulfate permease-like transporter
VSAQGRFDCSYFVVLSQVTTLANTAILQPDQGLFFPAIEYIEAKVFSHGLKDDHPKAVILDMLHISGLDYTTVHVS